MNESKTDGLEPTIACEGDGEPTVLACPYVESVVDGQRWSGKAEVRLEFRPRPGVRFHCLFDTGVSMGPAVFRTQSHPERVGQLVIDGHRRNGFGTKVNFSEDKSKMYVRWTPEEEPVQANGDNGTMMSRVRFSLFNFDLRGLPHHDGTELVQQIEFADPDWSVRIRSLGSTDEALKRKREEGGVHLTHAGDVARTDGSEFSGRDAVDILTALDHYLWFVAGTRFELCCPVGTEANGQHVWAWWSSPRRWEEGNLSWLDRRNPDQVGKLFPDFMDRWRRANWSDALQAIVYWYGLANDSARGIDAGIVSAQTALERLAFECCVVEWGLMSPEEFRRRPAVDLVRTLLGRLRIPVTLPVSASALSAVGPTGNSRWMDGAQAVTKIRNELAHGGRIRAGFSPECYIEAWTLAVWFVEMAVLALCGYDDLYWNRSSRTEERVPWAAVGQT